jgi:serine protease inhibitor
MKSGDRDSRCARLKPMEDTIQTPRCKLDCQGEVGPALAALGTSRALDPERAAAFETPPHFNMIVSRPFVAAIRDDITKAISFLGGVGAPE